MKTNAAQKAIQGEELVTSIEEDIILQLKKMKKAQDAEAVTI